MPKDLDIRFPAEVQDMILELTDPDSDVIWRATKGWLAVRLDDDDQDEIAICWVLGHIPVPKRKGVESE